jgi:hypothetical protein
METPSEAPSSNLWKTLPEKLLALSMHHLARLFLLVNGPQPSNAGSTEHALDTLLMHLGLARVTADSRPGWVKVRVTDEGFDMVALLMNTALGRTETSPSAAPTPTPAVPLTTATSRPRERLSLVHSRG